VAALLCVLAFLRPGQAEWEELPDGGDGGGLQGLAAKRLAMVREEGPMSILEDLGGPGLVDYKVFTLKLPKRENSEKRMVGVLGHFVPYRTRDDLLVLSACFAVSFVLSMLAPGLNFRLTQPRLTQPLSLITTTFFCDSLFSAVMFTTALISSGVEVQQNIGREEFLAMFFVPGVLLGLSEIVGNDWAQPVSGIPAVLSMLTFVGLQNPNFTFSVYGFESNAFGMIVLQVLLGLVPTLNEPRHFVGRLPAFSGGPVSGLVAFIVFNPFHARKIFEKNSITLPEGSKVQDAIAPLIILHLFFTQACFKIRRSIR